MSVTLVANLKFSSVHHVLSGDSLPASLADLVREDLLKVQDVYSPERSRWMGERGRIEGAVPAGRVEGQYATSEPVSVEVNFASDEPEPSAGDSRDGLAEQGTAGGYEHQETLDQFQAFISDLSMAGRFRVVGRPEVNAFRPPVKTPTIRSAIELSQGNPGPGAPSRGNFRSAVGESSFLRCPTIIFEAQPRPASTTLVTRLSPPVPNTNEPFPEHDDPDTCSNLRISAPRYPNSHDVFISSDLSAEITRLQHEASPCRQRIASYLNKIQGMRAAMGRHERFRSELIAGFEAEKDEVHLGWRRATERLDQKRDVSFAEHDHRHRKLQRAVKDVEKSAQLPLPKSSRQGTSLPTSRAGISGEP